MIKKEGFNGGELEGSRKCSRYRQSLSSISPKLVENEVKRAVGGRKLEMITNSFNFISTHLIFLLCMLSNIVKAPQLVVSLTAKVS
jgi:hypothetical protein